MERIKGKMVSSNKNVSFFLNDNNQLLVVPNSSIKDIHDSNTTFTENLIVKTIKPQSEQLFDIIYPFSLSWKAAYTYEYSFFIFFI